MWWTCAHGTYYIVFSSSCDVNLHLQWMSKYVIPTTQVNLPLHWKRTVRHIHPPHPSTPPDCDAAPQWQGCWTCCRTPSWGPTRPYRGLNCGDLQDHRKLAPRSRFLGSLRDFLFVTSESYLSTRRPEQNGTNFQMHYLERKMHFI